MVYSTAFQTALRVRFFSGMAENVYSVVPSSDQNWNVYPSLAGSVGLATVAPEDATMVSTEDPPSVSKQIEYCPEVPHSAFRVIFSPGIVLGTVLSHPRKVLPSLEGFAGAVTAVP